MTTVHNLIGDEFPFDIKLSAYFFNLIFWHDFPTLDYLAPTSAQYLSYVLFFIFCHLFNYDIITYKLMIVKSYSFFVKNLFSHKK